jgi:hypothetical protein
VPAVLEWPLHNLLKMEDSGQQPRLPANLADGPSQASIALLVMLANSYFIRSLCSVARFVLPADDTR